MMQSDADARWEMIGGRALAEIGAQVRLWVEMWDDDAVSYLAITDLGLVTAKGAVDHFARVSSRTVKITPWRDVKVEAWADYTEHIKRGWRFKLNDEDMPEAFPRSEVPGFVAALLRATQAAR